MPTSSTTTRFVFGFVRGVLNVGAAPANYVELNGTTAICEVGARSSPTPTPAIPSRAKRG